jgi:hypothetical protein
MDVRANVEWLKGSDKALAEVGSKATQKNVLRRTLTPPAEHLRDLWQAIAPRRFGYYASSIVVGGNNKLTSRQKGTAYKAGALGVVEIHIGSADVGGLQQEFGNVNHVAQPSGRPAWDASKAKIEADIGKGLWFQIEKAAARAARKRAKAA